MDTTLQDPFVGRVLDGRYRVESRIARGGMATVYLAVDDRLDREVALKVMHEHLAEDEEFVARFIREARAAARLSHPNVVQVFDQGSDGEVLYLAMEHLPGRTMRDVLSERGSLTPREALSLLDPVLDALAAAHRAGIMHRDVKPENVLLTDDGRVKVADFGLARAMTTSTATTGTLIGTVAYLSPELVARGIADARTDVYAAGILLYEMLTGRQPFTGDLPIQVAFQHVHEQVPPPSDLVPLLPTELDSLVLTATAQDPDDRPADAGQMLRLLKGVRAAVPPEALDRRPAGGREAAAGDTQVVERPATAGHTEALPVDVARLPPRPRALDLRSPGRERDVMELDGGDPVLVSGRVMNRRRRRGTALLVLVLALAAALGTGAWWWVAGPGAYVTTPRVEGRPLAEAVATIEANGLAATVVEVFDDTVPAGSVVRTDPAGGERVPKDGAVEVTVSKGPELVEVPVLTGLTPEKADTALAQARLALGEVTHAYDDKAKAGTIASSAPAAGQQLRHGETVSVVVSKGPQPVKVPTLVGLTQAEAERALTDVRLKATVSQEQSEQVEKGRVISQQPGSGTLLPGQSVRLVVSTGPPLVEVPNVFRMRFAEARRVLEAAGFTVERQGSRILDQVFEQSPGGGELAPKGSVVRVRTF